MIFTPAQYILLAKVIIQVLLLLLKSAALISAIYFALFVPSFITPYFAGTHDDERVRQAQIVYYCCFVVIAFLSLLMIEQVIRTICSLVRDAIPSCAKFAKPKSPPAEGTPSPADDTETPTPMWWRLTYLAVLFTLLVAILFGTLYPLVKAREWRHVFKHAGRTDLEQSATAMAWFLGITLVVGTISLLRISCMFLVQCVNVFIRCLGDRKKKKTKNAYVMNETAFPVVREGAPPPNDPRQSWERE